MNKTELINFEMKKSVGQLTNELMDIDLSDKTYKVYETLCFLVEHDAFNPKTLSWIHKCMLNMEMLGTDQTSKVIYEDLDGKNG